MRDIYIGKVAVAPPFEHYTDIVYRSQSTMIRLLLILFSNCRTVLNIGDLF